MILVTGATGRTGQRVVTHLLSSGQAVRILVRPHSVVPGHWDGVERATGDLDDPASLQQAMSGVDGLFLLSPMDPDLDRLERSAIDAAMRVGVGHIVKMSTTKPEPDSPISWWRAHWRAEQHLRACERPWTILRPNGIAFFLLDFARDVREHGVMRTAAGDGRMALVDPDDIAAVAAHVFADRARYTGAVLDITGPDAVSYADVARILTALIGRRVAHVDVSVDAARSALRDGRPDWEVEGVLANWLMTRDGSGGFDRVTDEVERVTGRRARELRVFLRAHVDAFRPRAVGLSGEAERPGTTG